MDITNDQIIINFGHLWSLMVIGIKVKCLDFNIFGNEYKICVVTHLLYLEKSGFYKVLKVFPYYGKRSWGFEK